MIIILIHEKKGFIKLLFFLKKLDFILKTINLIFENEGHYLIKFIADKSLVFIDSFELIESGW